MDYPDHEDVDYKALLRIANATAYELASPSARSNLIDQIGADAVEQYLEEVKAGTEIHNPYGWIKVTARRRALDAIDKWELDKKSTYALEADRGNNDYYSDAISRSLINVIDGKELDPGDAVVAHLWVAGLIEKAYPSSSVNRDIAVACLVEGSRPRDIAADFEMDAKVIGNRLVRIRQRLRSTLPTVDPM